MGRISFVGLILRHHMMFATFSTGVMISHLTPYDPAYQERVGTITHALASRSGTWAAGHQAEAIIYGIVQQQAQLAAFVDNFRLFGVVCIFCIPLLFLFKNVKVPAVKVDVH
jgi:DHA2 family multidrug resistance protein